MFTVRRVERAGSSVSMIGSDCVFLASFSQIVLSTRLVDIGQD